MQAHKLGKVLAASGLASLLLAHASVCAAQTAAQGPDPLPTLGFEPNRAPRPILAASSAVLSDADVEGAPKMTDVRAAAPQLAFTYTAYGAQAKAVGAQGYGGALFASGQNAVLGGGAMVWGAPVQRLTLIGDAQRNVWGNFSPSVAAVVHLLGRPYAGWSLGGLGKLKVDGFAGGPSKDEIEAELEVGALVSLTEARWHLDMNAIGGRGLGDDGEMDIEGRLRIGRDLGKWARVGLDGQFRARVAGPRYLPNGRTYDFSGGAQMLLGDRGFYGALTAGPSTAGTTSTAVGFASMIAVGGST